MRQMNVLRMGLTALVFSLAHTACGDKAYRESSRTETPPPDAGQTASGGAATSGIDPNAAAGGEQMAGQGNAAGMRPEQKTVYFEYDRSDIRDSDRATLESHAAYLRANSGAQVRLEGHADERGSREYNLALGERRAIAVRSLLNILGVSLQQISIHSYGEEMPVDVNHTESAWSMNRRVEIVYTTP